MSLYVNRVVLEVNGVSFSDFDSFTENSVTFHKQVNMMNKTGHAAMTPRYGFSISYDSEIQLSPLDTAFLHLICPSSFFVSLGRSPRTATIN